jgi:oligosaccharide repeat unit polymerase
MAAGLMEGTAASSMCWVLIVFGMVSPALIYRVELEYYGGMGIASLLAAVVVLYTLINPAMYMIDPALARSYSLLVGFMTARDLLPGVLCSVTFLAALLATVKVLPRAGSPAGVIRFPSSAIPGDSRRKLFLLIFFLCVLGMVFFFLRNQLFFGSPFGSVTAQYVRDEARPYVPVVSTCTDVFSAVILISSLLVFWQIDAGVWPRWAACLSILLAAMFAIADGNRMLLVPAVLTIIGWYGLRIRLRPGHVALGIVVLSLVTLLANARYAKDETGLIERVEAIFDVENFRPFWSGDPYGPNTLLTLEALRISEGGQLDLGAGYLRALPSVLPTFATGGRWQTPAGRFAEDFYLSRGETYYAGTGLAYSTIAEAFVNFWYVGTILLGALSGIACRKVMTVCSAEDQRSRASFACFVLFIVPVIVRNSLTIYFAPLMIIQILLSLYTIKLCSRRDRSAGNKMGAGEVPA